MFTHTDSNPYPSPCPFHVFHASRFQKYTKHRATPPHNMLHNIPHLRTPHYPSSPLPAPSHPLPSRPSHPVPPRCTNRTLHSQHITHPKHLTLNPPHCNRAQHLSSQSNTITPQDVALQRTIRYEIPEINSQKFLICDPKRCLKWNESDCIAFLQKKPMAVALILSITRKTVTCLVVFVLWSCNAGLWKAFLALTNGFRREVS